MSDSQINLFGNQLSRLHELSYLANQGESYEELAIKIKDMLRDQQQQKQLFPYLKNLGFKPWVYWRIHLLYSSIRIVNTQ